LVQGPDSSGSEVAAVLAGASSAAHRAGPDDPQPGIVVAAVAGTLLTALAVVVTVTGGLSTHPWPAAIGRGAIVAVPIAVGLYAWQRRPRSRFGRLLVAVGAGWSITTLAGSTNSVLYSTGRVAAWIVEIAFVYAILAFPSGRLSGRADRALVVALSVLLLVGYMPTALLAQRYPTPTPWTECSSACPDNAFQVVDTEPRFVVHGLPAVREALTILVFLGVAAVLARRVSTATRLTRLALAPVLTVATARLVVYAAAILVRRVSPNSAAVDVLAWTLALLIPVMAIGFLVGLVRWRMFAGAALERLAQGLHPRPDAERLRSVLAEALGDPSLLLAYWRHGGRGDWVDANGDRVELPAPGAGRSITGIYDEDGLRLAAIVHDDALNDHPDLVEAAATFAIMAFENERLGAQVESSLREVQESRSRILATADEERRRIERDLHDGAQQRLVGMRIKLELAEELMPSDPARGRELLHEIGDETVEALEEVRSLAHGVYPVLLARGGLADALREAVLRSPISTSLEHTGVARYREAVESAVYFCCLEALQNAAKHASGATKVTVALVDDGILRFEVRDDGAGFDPATASGAGLTNMRDRLAAVGGELTVLTAAGEGTRVIGRVPVTRFPRRS
jgi:signal transduction histidine kinase